MSKLKFDDGEEFDVSKKLHVERRRDGYYVVGEGMLCPVDSFEDGMKLIEELK